MEVNREDVKMARENLVKISKKIGSLSLMNTNPHVKWAFATILKTIELLTPPVDDAAFKDVKIRTTKVAKPKKKVKPVIKGFDLPKKTSEVVERTKKYDEENDSKIAFYKESIDKTVEELVKKEEKETEEAKE